VLLLKCIEQAIINRLSIYDFLRGEESYKAGWTDNTEQLFNLKLDNKKMLSKNRNAIVDRIRPMLMKGIMFDKGRL
jgi:CelD/BcsL family acetyltransferase involved in cellulose biosynthesis